MITLGIESSCGETGMALYCSKPQIWKVRTTLPTRIARVLFTVRGSQMVLLHEFIKKTQATPEQDLNMAVSRIDF